MNFRKNLNIRYISKKSDIYQKNRFFRFFLEKIDFLPTLLGSSSSDFTKKNCIEHGTDLKEQSHFIDPVHESLDLLAFTTELIVADNTMIFIGL